MDGAAFLIPPRHGSATSGKEAPALLKRRFEAASACLKAHPTDLPWKFLAELAPMLQPPTIRELPAPLDEIPLLRKLFEGMARHGDSLEPVSFARYLAGAMFYFLPHELPLTPWPSHLPLWIRVAYFQWSMARPQCFEGPVEADLYSRWLDRWLKGLAVEFLDGKGWEDLPEYQHFRMRRLMEELSLDGAIQVEKCT